jgi:hypothetical protein
MVLLPKVGTVAELEAKIREHEALMALPESQEHERNVPEERRFKPRGQ